MSSLLLLDAILLDVFDYLYFTEIIQGFFDIMCHNSHIHELIHSRLRAVHLSKVDLRAMTKSQFRYICRCLREREHSLEKIQHLTLSNRHTFGQIRLLLSQLSFEQMINLKHLTLIEPSLDEYHILFPTQVSQLTHLTLENPGGDDNDQVQLIDEMNDLIVLSVRSASSVQFRCEYPRVETLIVSQLNFIDLIGLSTFFPNLRHLDVTLVGTEIDFNQIRIPLLSTLKLRTVNVSHDLCEKFLVNFLQLREVFYSNRIACTKTSRFHGYRCQTLLERLPLLEQFEINVYLFNVQAMDICELAASFQSSFYLSKKWNIVCESRAGSNDFHVYSVPMPDLTELDTATDSLVSSAVLPIDDPYAHVEHLKLDVTSNWPLVTRFFPNVHSLELSQVHFSRMIPTLSIVSYLNKSLFLSKLRRLILPSPCHFDDPLLHHLLQQSAPNIDQLDISCYHFLRLIKTNILQSPLSIRQLTLRDDYLPLTHTPIFIEFFKTNLNCLSLFLPNSAALPETMQSLLDGCQHLYSLHVRLTDPISMLIHVQLCQMIQKRTDASAELCPTSIRIWQG